MRVAFVSIDGMPDIRVEKEIMVVKRLGHEVYFIGPYRYTSLIDPSMIDSRHVFSARPCALLGIEPCRFMARRRLSRILRRVRPDVVVAVNIKTMGLVAGLADHVVFDDHEFYPNLAAFRYIVEKPGGLVDKASGLRAIQWFSEKTWEALLESTIWTVSEYVARIYRVMGGRRVYVLRNYPSRLELESTVFRELGVDRINMCFIGSYNTMKHLGIMHRRITEFLEIIRSHPLFGEKLFMNMFGRGRLFGDEKGFIHHGFIEKELDLLEKLTHMHLCPIPYTPMPIHDYYSPNKLYQCMAAGAAPIIVDTMIEAVKEYGGRGMMVIDSYRFEDSLREIIEHALSMTGEEMNSLRREAYRAVRTRPWDSYEEAIRESIEGA